MHAGRIFRYVVQEFLQQWHNVVVTCVAAAPPAFADHLAPLRSPPVASEATR